jgi:hypothetical protein
MRLRHWEIPSEDLSAHFDPLALPFATTEKLSDGDDQAQRQASEENLFRKWNLLTRKR